MLEEQLRNFKIGYYATSLHFRSEDEILCTYYNGRLGQLESGKRHIMFSEDNWGGLGALGAICFNLLKNPLKTYEGIKDAYGW